MEILMGWDREFNESLHGSLGFKESIHPSRCI